MENDNSTFAMKGKKIERKMREMMEILTRETAGTEDES